MCMTLIKKLEIFAKLFQMIKTYDEVFDVFIWFSIKVIEQTKFL